MPPDPPANPPSPRPVAPIRPGLRVVLYGVTWLPFLTVICAAIAANVR